MSRRERATHSAVASKGGTVMACIKKAPKQPWEASRYVVTLFNAATITPQTTEHYHTGLIRLYGLQCKFRPDQGLDMKEKLVQRQLH